MKQIIIFLVFFVWTTGCKIGSIPQPIDGYEYVRYGTFFGECAGYCSGDIQIDTNGIRQRASGWDRDGELPKIDRQEVVEGFYLTELLSKIDFSKFKKLDEVIGCPDCADGGGEWVEIKRNGQTQKVTFEYGREPEELEESIGLFRTYLSAFNVDTKVEVDFNNRVLLNQSGQVKNFLCSRGCNQYLISLDNDATEQFYYPEYVEREFLEDGLNLSFHAVLMTDSTGISKPSPTDQPTFDFNAPNMRLFDVKKR